MIGDVSNLIKANLVLLRKFEIRSFMIRGHALPLLGD
jgi:hypothetical protein